MSLVIDRISDSAKRGSEHCNSYFEHPYNYICNEGNIDICIYISIMISIGVSIWISMQPWNHKAQFYLPLPQEKYNHRDDDDGNQDTSHRTTDSCTCNVPGAFWETLTRSYIYELASFFTSVCNTDLPIYRSDVLHEIFNGAFEIPNKMSYPCNDEYDCI